MARHETQRLVFLSFKTEEHEVARKLQSALVSMGHAVWWQEDLQCGQEWHGEIDEALNQASCIVVLWSSASSTSVWVKHEASQAMARGVYAPIKIDPVAVPPPYDRIQATDLLNWDGESNHPGFQNLLRRVEELLPPRQTWIERTTATARRNRASLAMAGLLAASLFLLVSISEQVAQQLRSQRDSTALLDQYARVLAEVKADQTKADALLGEYRSSLFSIQSRTSQLLEPDIRTRYVFDPTGTGYFGIQNVGRSPTQLKAFELKYDGATTPNTKLALDRILGREASGLVSAHPIRGNEILQPGDALFLFRFPFGEFGADQACGQDLMRQQFVARFSIMVKYTQSTQEVTSSLKHKPPADDLCR